MSRDLEGLARSLAALIAAGGDLILFGKDDAQTRAAKRSYEEGLALLAEAEEGAL